MIEMPEVKIIHTIDDFEPNDIIEFKYPASKGQQLQYTFGVGKLVRVIKHRAGNKSVELRNSNGKVIITENNIRWEQTINHKNKHNQGSQLTCQIKLSIS